MEIELLKPKKIVIQEEVCITESIIKVLNITDTYSSVSATIQIGNTMPSVCILWEGEDYKNIGQWTDEDVKNRILEII